MHDDPNNTLTLIRYILQHPDTGLVRRPVELIGVRQAAARYGVSERTMRRHCEDHGIAIMDRGLWLVAIPASDALYANDTGALHRAQHDIKLISELTCWPTSLSTPEGDQLIPIAWGENDPEESKMQIEPSRTQRFPETLRLKLPRGMQAVLQHAARRRVQSTSDYVRQALLERLQQEGLTLTDTGVVRRSEEV